MQLWSGLSCVSGRQVVQCGRSADNLLEAHGFEIKRFRVDFNLACMITYTNNITANPLLQTTEILVSKGTTLLSTKLMFNLLKKINFHTFVQYASMTYFKYI